MERHVVSAELPKRRKITKSRFGCQTCKLKRMKCDERKPVCENCEKRSLECSYNRSFQFSTKYEKLNPKAKPSLPVESSLQSEFEAIDPSVFVKGSCPSSSKATTLRSPSIPDTTLDLKHPVSPLDHGVFNDGLQALNPEFLSSSGEPRPDIIQPSELTPESDPVESNSQQDTNESLLRETSSSSRSPTRANSTDLTWPRQRSKSQKEWKSLLQNYYRMNNASPPQPMSDDGTKLVEYYFQDTCGIYSAYDSAMNPFRSTIGKLWEDSPSMYYAIQSMSAVHMANYVPGMAKTGLVMQRKAYECLQEELRAPLGDAIDRDRLLLTILLVGLTACWHDSNDLGFAHLSAARYLIQPRLTQEAGESKPTNNDQFFVEALIYWEMLMSFVSPEPIEQSFERKMRFNDVESHDDKEKSKETAIVPHPWSGVAPRMQMLFAEVGRLLRHRQVSLMDDADLGQIHRLITSATDLEEELLSASVPSPNDIIDVGDKRTSKEDFITIAEVTRCSALLSIYRAFPELLQSRLRVTQAQSFDHSFTGFEALNEDADPTTWLTSFAIHILDDIAKVPSSSGTRPLQLLLLNTAASELRLSNTLLPSLDNGDSLSFNIQVYKARDFAISRLTELAARLPAKPVYKIVELVRETWRRNDAGDDVFWMDVMCQKGWQTVMG